MSETKFTPGRWSVSIDDDGEYAITKNGSFITYAFPTELGFEEGTTESNAHLIAAAPELYEALVSLIDSAEYLLNFAKEQCEFMGDVDEEQGFIETARAALAKARGES